MTASLVGRPVRAAYAVLWLVFNSSQNFTDIFQELWKFLVYSFSWHIKLPIVKTVQKKLGHYDFLISKFNKPYLIDIIAYLKFTSLVFQKQGF